MDTKTLTFTKRDLDAMSPEQFSNLLLTAQAIRATAVVRRPDGSIKYDEPDKAGSYGEVHLTKEDDHA